MKKLLLTLLVLGIMVGCKTNGQQKEQPTLSENPPPDRPPQGMPPGGAPLGIPPGGPEGMPPMPFALTPHEDAAIYIKEGAQFSDNEYKDNEVKISVAKEASGISGNSAEGVLLTSTQYSANGVVVSDGSYTFGGKKDFYTVVPNLDKDYIGTTVSTTLNPNSEYNYNSVLLFTLDADVPKGTKTGSSGIDAANDGGMVYVVNAYLQVDGAQRYVSSTFGKASTIVNDSYLVSTGNANGHTNDIDLPFSNEALLIDGAARTNFTIGGAKTYYFNSTVVAEGWAALSTDAAAPEGLHLYAYNSKAYALNGGYGTYADFFCNVHLYGSYLEAAEIGGIIAKSGHINILDGSSASAETLKLNTGNTTNKGSHIVAGRNAMMIHAPDMAGVGLKAVDHGTLNIQNSILETSNNIKSKFDYNTYGADDKAFVDYVMGDVILIKSTSAIVSIDNSKLISSNGVLFHTVLNSDRMGNFLKADDNKAKDEQGNIIVKPIALSLMSMDANGDILHDDYQRNMVLQLSGTILTGRINQGTHATWKKMWALKGVEKAHWLSDTEWTGSNELSVSLDGTSRWTVTDTSAMSSLIIAEGAAITAPEGHTLKMTVDGVAQEVAPGTYSGNIVLSPKKK